MQTKMNPRIINLKVVTVACAMGFPALSANGAVLLLGNHIKSSTGDETFSQVFNSGNPLFNFTEGNVYVSFTLTFTNPANPGVLSTNQSFGGYSHSAGDNFGQNWQQSMVGVTYYGGRDDIANQAIIPGEPLTLVVKYELNGPGVDGDTVKFWVNPALGTGTGPTPDDAHPSRIWNPAAISSNDMRFRLGNAPNTNVMTYENVTVYSGNDSPFIPEPSTALLTAMGVGLLTFRRRSR